MLLDNEERLKECSNWLSSKEAIFLVEVLSDLYNQVANELLEDQNLDPKNWEYFTAVLLGERQGLRIVEKVIYALKSKLSQNTPERMARYKGILKGLGHFIQTIKFIKDKGEA